MDEAAPFRLRSLRVDDAGEIPGAPGLSAVFDPFLSAFATETIGAGGQAWAAERDRQAVGLLLTDPVEHVASVFAPDLSVAAALAARSPEPAVYAEWPVGTELEPFGLYAASVAREPSHRFRHPLRLLGPDDAPRIAGMLAEVYGPRYDRWIGVAFRAGERCLAVEDRGELLGLGWLLVAGPVARLHGLTVRGEFRRLGIGADLVFGRLAIARRFGAGRAISEIAERNLASRATAERAGMRPEGRLALYAPRNRSPPGLAPTSG